MRYRWGVVALGVLAGDEKNDINRVHKSPQPQIPLWKSILHIYETPQILRSMIFTTVSCLQSDNAVSTSNTRNISKHQYSIRELAESGNMKLHTAYVTMETIEIKQHTSQPQTLVLLPPLRLSPSGLMASPQLGSSSISSWVKSVVAPSGLTRHEAGDGSCNREIRVV